jgi:hypothetical protein
MNLGIYHRGILIAPCKTPLEVWEKMQTWNSVLDPLEVKRIEQEPSTRESRNGVRNAH